MGESYYISLFYFQVQASHFEGLITTIVGYILLAITLIICHVSFNEPAMSFLSKSTHNNKVVFPCVFIKVGVGEGISVGRFEINEICHCIQYFLKSFLSHTFFLDEMLQALATLVKFHRSRRLLGVCYIVVKVIQL